MAKQTRLRLKTTGSRTEVLVLVKHPMESGLRQDHRTSQRILADYIERMTFALNGSVVAEALLGPGVASDPLTGIILNEVKQGDRVTVKWTDSRGESGMAEKSIK